MTSSTDDLVHNIEGNRGLQDLNERDMLEATAIAQTLSLERTQEVGLSKRTLRSGLMLTPFTAHADASQAARARP